MTGADLDNSNTPAGNLMVAGDDVVRLKLENLAKSAAVTIDAQAVNSSGNPVGAKHAPITLKVE